LIDRGKHLDAAAEQQTKGDADHAAGADFAAERAASQL
jgi:hypothetical protein